MTKAGRAKEQNRVKTFCLLQLKNETCLYTLKFTFLKSNRHLPPIPVNSKDIVQSYSYTIIEM